MELLDKAHPIVIHFPIAILVLFCILEIGLIFIRRIELNYFSLTLLVLGVFGGVLAVLSGNLSFQKLQSEGSLSQINYFFIEKHEYWATLTLWYFFAILIFKLYLVIKKKNEIMLRIIFVMFTVLGLILLYKTADAGGLLVYEFGIGTKLIK